MSQKRSHPAPPSIATIAAELHASVVELERVSARLSELNLPTWKAITRGGDLLTEGITLHQRFVAALEALSNEVGVMRDRHNACADALAAQAARIDARRATHQAIEDRFATLASAARETDELLRAIPTGGVTGGDATAHAAAVSAGFAAARERIGRAVDEAGVVAAEAREAGLTDLEQQASTVRTQLEGMMRIVARAAPDA